MIDARWLKSLPPMLRKYPEYVAGIGENLSCSILDGTNSIGVSRVQSLQSGEDTLLFVEISGVGGRKL